MGARFRLYRSQILQVNTCWKAVAEIYTMHSFAPFSNLNFLFENRKKMHCLPNLLNLTQNYENRTSAFWNRTSQKPRLTLNKIETYLLICFSDNV